MTDTKIFFSILMFSILLYGMLSFMGYENHDIDISSKPSLSNLGTFLNLNINTTGLPFMIPAFLWVMNSTIIYLGIRLVRGI